MLAQLDRGRRHVTPRGLHPWAEPVQRLRTAADRAGVRISVPRPGERLDADAPIPPTDWWSAIG